MDWSFKLYWISVDKLGCIRPSIYPSIYIHLPSTIYHLSINQFIGQFNSIQFNVKHILEYSRAHLYVVIVRLLFSSVNCSFSRYITVSQQVRSGQVRSGQVKSICLLYLCSCDPQDTSSLPGNHSYKFDSFTHSR